MTQSPRDLAVQRAKQQREQERLLQDLLGILDALDHACNHWQQAEAAHQPSLSSQRARRHQGGLKAWLQRWQKSWKAWWKQQFSATATPSAPLASSSGDASDEVGELLTSAREGLEMIRRSLLDVMRQRQVVPLNAQGQTFDPGQMYALGATESDDVPENTVIQEVVRGYLWQNRVLREAQVIVAKQPSATDTTTL